MSHDLPGMAEQAVVNHLLAATERLERIAVLLAILERHIAIEREEFLRLRQSLVEYGQQHQTAAVADDLSVGLDR